MEESVQKRNRWIRLVLCIDIHGREALCNLLHNKDNNQNIKGLPEDPTRLYEFFKKNTKIIQESRHVNSDQQAILLPPSNEVDSKDFDITLLRYLIQAFVISGNWNKIGPNDTSIKGFVLKLTKLRNNFYHDEKCKVMNEKTFDEKWSKMEDILKGLSYKKDFEGLKTCSLDTPQLKQKAEYYNSIADFDEIISEYKTKCQKEGTSVKGVHFIRREYKVVGSDQILTNPEECLGEHDTILIGGMAGSGKSTSAQQMRFLWAKDEILKDKKLLYYDVEQIDRKKTVKSFFAPLFFSDLETSSSSSFKASTTEMEDVVIAIDGVDKLSISDRLSSFESKEGYLDELRTKILNNEKICGFETMIGISHGYIFPKSQLILFGRHHEINRLKQLKHQKDSYVFKPYKRKELELLGLNDEMIKEFISLKRCKINDCSCNGCTNIYQKIKEIDILKVPAHLETYMDSPEVDTHDNQIIETQLYIRILLNDFKNHTRVGSKIEYKTFGDMKGNKKFNKLRDNIYQIAEMSFASFVNEKEHIDLYIDEHPDSNENTYFTFKETDKLDEEYNIVIKREILEEIDLFSIHYDGDSVQLKPRHLKIMEFLAACHIFQNIDLLDAHLDEMHAKRRLTMISYCAGLFSSYSLTEDFVNELLKPSSCSFDMFVRRLYDRQSFKDESLDNDLWLKLVEDSERWYGLVKNNKIPSFILDAINQEIKIPESLLPKTIVFFNIFNLKFDWYNLNQYSLLILNKNKFSNNYNIESFLNENEGYKIIILGDIYMNDEEHFHKFLDLYDDCRISFRIRKLSILIKLSSFIVHKYIQITSLFLDTSDMETIYMIFNALTKSASNKPSILIKYLGIRYEFLDISQTERFIEFGLINVDVISISHLNELDENEIKTIRDLESKHESKLINFQFKKSNFTCFYDLPSLNKRHISQIFGFIEDKDLKKLEKLLDKFPRIETFESDLNKYRIIDPMYPFIYYYDANQKKTKSSFYLHFHCVNFSEVSPDVFAKALSKIPTLECSYDEKRIPSSHWEKLSSFEDCQIKELRMWFTAPLKNDNFIHVYKIKTSILQLIFLFDTCLSYALKCIEECDDDVRTKKDVRVFVVKNDINDIHNDEYYEEKEILRSPLKKLGYKKRDKLRGREEFETLRDGEREWKWWCLEIQTIVNTNKDPLLPTKKQRTQSA